MDKWKVFCLEVDMLIQTLALSDRDVIIGIHHRREWTKPARQKSSLCASLAVEDIVACHHSISG
jgi:hypothetical protein